jgi:hypothetical protein
MRTEKRRKVFRRAKDARVFAIHGVPVESKTLRL